ncbi:MAG: type II toxin-antitoxin system VapC family toxin [Patescibacteria group bacterium]|nr:type II toxin-antitoxin system VapC family toxin [Patescibacteria group bacterium]
MPTVYLETTIPSYLAAYPSRDLIVAAHQQITHEWWRTAPDRFDLYISEAVVSEIRNGDPTAVARRIAIVDGLPVLELNEEVRRLVHQYDQRLGLIGRARADLPHLAFAVAYQMEYLVTWNCRHIANGEIIRRLLTVNRQLRLATPLLVTPEEILCSPDEEEV